MEKIKMYLVDDDALFLRLLANFIGSQQNIDVLATAHDGPTLLQMLKQAQELPHIIILDLKMREMDGIEVTQYLQAEYPQIKIIVISSHYQESFMAFMLKTGVSAFLPKGVSPEELIEIIQTVHAKGFYLMQEQIKSIKDQLPNKSPRPVFEQDKLFTEREIEVLRLISMQKTAKEIADILFITQRTVEGRKNSMFMKTGAKNVAGLVIYAIQNGILNVNDLPLISS